MLLSVDGEDQFNPDYLILPRTYFIMGQVNIRLVLEPYEFTLFIHDTLAGNSGPCNLKLVLVLEKRFQLMEVMK